MGKTSSNVQQAEPLAAYWNASALPAMPVFLRELIGAAKHQLHVSKIVIFGTRARTDCQPTSDYDVAFMLDDTQGWARFVADQLNWPGKHFKKWHGRKDCTCKKQKGDAFNIGPIVRVRPGFGSQ